MKSRTFVRLKSLLLGLSFAVLTAGATPLAALSAPIAPQPTASISYSSYIYVSWPAVSGASNGYYIRRGTTSNYDSATVIKTVSSSVTGLYDYGVVAGQTYYYWICPRYTQGGTYYYAYNKSKYDWGKLAAATPIAPQPTASISYSSYIYVSWPAVSGASNGYYIRRGTTSNYDSSTVIKTVSSSVTGLYDYGVVAGQTYYYWICPRYTQGGTYYYAYNKSKYDWGKLAAATPIAPQPTASISYSSYIYVSWPAVSGASNGYYIRRGTTSNYDSSTVIKTVSSSVTGLYDYGVVAGQKYYYWICPRYTQGGSYYYAYNKSKYDWGQLKVVYTTPVAPQPTVSISYSSYIYVSWPAVSGASNGYYIRRGTTSNYDSSTVIKTVSSSVTGLYDYDVRAGQTYYYWICPRYTQGGTYYYSYNKSKYDYGWLRRY